ncbi:MAG: hypothetical protein ACE5FW_00695 [Candidatus Aenigmatarchaeota archaeon]
MKVHLTKKKVLYLAGIATAIGVASVLHERSKEKAEETKKSRELRTRIASFKGKLREKERHLVEGRIGRIKLKIDRMVPKKPKHAKKPKEEPLEEIDKAKVAKALKDAVIDYITEEMEDKLEDMEIRRPELERMVDLVAEKTEQVLLSIGLEDFIKKNEALEKEIVQVLRVIRPKLLAVLKKSSPLTRAAASSSGRATSKN